MAERCHGHHQDLCRLDDAGRDVHTHAGEEVQLAEEPTGAMAGNDPVPLVRADRYLDFSRQDHKEVVTGIALTIEVIVHGNGPSRTQRLEDGQVGFVKCREHDGIIHHGLRVCPN